MRTLFLSLAILVGLLNSSSAVKGGTPKLQFGGPEVCCDGLAPSLSFDELPHLSFDRLLRRYVDENGQVCYSQWARSDADVALLEEYLHSLGAVDPNLPASQEGRMAYYINAYNALTLRGILQEYPIVSIQRITEKHRGYDVFDGLKVWAAGEYISLNEIENDVLRPLRDPRIHFALVCAARGCPRLLNRAYTPDQLDSLLDLNAREFFTDRNRFHISRLHRTVKMSPILKWYREDFGESSQEVVASVFAYLPTDDQQWLGSHSQWAFEYLGYNWALNDRCPSPHVFFSAPGYRIWSKLSPLAEKVKPSKELGSRILHKGDPTKHAKSF